MTMSTSLGPPILPFPECTPLCHVNSPPRHEEVEIALRTGKLGSGLGFVLLHGTLAEAWSLLVLRGLLSLAAPGILSPLCYLA